MRKNAIPGMWASAVLYALLIFVFSAIPGNYVPEEVSHWDKLCHFILYIPFGFLVIRALGSSFCPGKLYSLLAAFFVICIYALSDEFHQIFVPGRTFSYFDMMADAAGGLTGCFLYTLKENLWPR